MNQIFQSLQMVIENENTVRIGYCGTLQFFSPPKQNSSNFLQFFKNWFWVYNPENSDTSTRSAYYLFKGVEILHHEKRISPEQLQIHLWGIIDDKIIPQIKSMNIDQYVTIDGYFDKKSSREKMKQMDIFFLPLESGIGKNKPVFIPGKLYEYLCYTKPILVLANESDCTDIVKKSGLGIVIDPTNHLLIAETLLKIITSKGELDKMVPNMEYIDQFSFKKLTRTLSEEFTKVLASGSHEI